MTSAILAINSIDRFTQDTLQTNVPNPRYDPNNPTAQPRFIEVMAQQNSSLSAALEQGYLGTSISTSNNFSIISPGALIYGYIKKIAVSVVQFNYNVPTVIPWKNDILYINVANSQTEESVIFDFVIPWGFYSAAELAAVTQRIMLNNDNFSRMVGGVDGFRISFKSESGYVFSVESILVSLYFPTIDTIRDLALFPDDEAASLIVLKTYRLFGINLQNSSPSQVQYSQAIPTFLYTPYVDIISVALTKYQKIKDTDTSPNKTGSIIARIYLQGVGVAMPQWYSSSLVSALGTAPFTVVQDNNYSKIIRWSREETVNSLDFQLRDQYGELLWAKWNPNEFTLPLPYDPDTDPRPTMTFNSEFQMTLLCVEGDRESDY